MCMQCVTECDLNSVCLRSDCWLCKLFTPRSRLLNAAEYKLVHDCASVVVLVVTAAGLLERLYSDTCAKYKAWTEHNITSSALYCSSAVLGPVLLSDDELSNLFCAGWVRGQIAAGHAPSSILQELQQTSSWLN